MGRIGTVEIIIILAIIILIFGARKLPELAKAIGKSVVELKDGLKGSTRDDESATNNSSSDK